MQDLTPVGLTEDGTCLLLVTAAGEKFVLPVDDQVQRLVGSSRRAAAGAPPSSPSSTAAGTPAGPPPTRQQEHTMDSALRPRDIQARIRAGETAETVAAAAGTSVEAIMPYASPVLAERAHQAEMALRASVRRGSAPGAGARTLGDAVGQYLAARGLSDDDVAWDSWRRADGRWALTARVEADGGAREATFVHDLAGRYVVADNDEARLLTGERSAHDPGGPGGPGDAAGGAGPAPRRLSAVEDPAARRPTRAGAEPGDLGDDAIALVRGPVDTDGPDERREPTVLDRPPRDLADEPTVEVGADPADAALADDDQVDEAQEAGDDAAPADRVDEADRAEDEPQEQPELDLGVPPEQPDPEADKPRRGRRGRASVPSWDEIMFGGGAGQERPEPDAER